MYLFPLSTPKCQYCLCKQQIHRLFFPICLFSLFQSTLFLSVGNVVWMDKVTAARAMLKLSKSYDQVRQERGFLPDVIPRKVKPKRNEAMEADTGKCMFTKSNTRLHSTVGCWPRWLSWMRIRLETRRLRFDSRRGRQHSFMEIDYEIFSMVILSLPLIQEGQLSVSVERMCTIQVNRLEDWACKPVVS